MAQSGLPPGDCRHLGHHHQLLRLLGTVRLHGAQRCRAGSCWSDAPGAHPCSAQPAPAACRSCCAGRCRSRRYPASGSCNASRCLPAGRPRPAPTRSSNLLGEGRAASRGMGQCPPGSRTRVRGLSTARPSHQLSTVPSLPPPPPQLQHEAGRAPNTKGSLGGTGHPWTLQGSGTRQRCGSRGGACSGSTDPSSCLAAKQSLLGGPEPLSQADLGKRSPPRAVLALWGPSVPLVVSLSRIMKDPITFPGPSSSRSASFLLMPLKNHLGQEQSTQRPPSGTREPRWRGLGGVSPRHRGDTGQEGGWPQLGNVGARGMGWPRRDAHSSVSSESARAT